jgi:DNA-binding transcriptional ArsR family regulator
MVSCDVRVVDLNAVRAAREALEQGGRIGVVAAVFAALGDPTRLGLLTTLARAPLCTCDLAAVLGVTESAVSHQLRLLKELDLVRSRREGKMMYHELADDHVRVLIRIAEEHVSEGKG